MKRNNGVINRETKFEDLPELLRPQEVRAFLGIGYNAVYKALEGGELPSRKIGGVIFIPKRELLEVPVG